MVQGLCSLLVALQGFTQTKVHWELHEAFSEFSYPVRKERLALGPKDILTVI